MASIRDFARRALRHLALPEPARSGKTLNVIVEDSRALPDFRIHCACPLVANYVWRAAHEQGCTTIKVHAPFGHTHEFDTIDFLRRFTIQRLGYLPRPFSIRGKTPRYLATVGHQALGNVFDTMTPTFRVTETITAVSSDAGGKELSHA